MRGRVYLIDNFFFDWVGTAEDLYLRKELSSGAVLDSLHQYPTFTKLLLSLSFSPHIVTGWPCAESSQILSPTLKCA